jgi:hypothetical protein
VRVIRRMPDVTRVTRTIAAHAHARNVNGEPVRGEQEADEQDQNDENPE